MDEVTEAGRGYVVLAEQLPYGADKARWETVLRGTFVSRDAALEAGLERLGGEPAGESEPQPRRLVAIPLSYFQIRVAEVERVERLVWRDAPEPEKADAP